MGQTRVQLRNEVMRNLGHPFVKIELCADHLNDAINRARDMWIKWAVGNATQETYMTLLLRDGHWIYDLPTGVTEVVDYRDEFGGFGSAGSNHTYNSGGPQVLFSLDNAMYMSGFMNSNSYNGFGSYNLIDYELAKMTLGDLERQHVNKYTWKYHRGSNQLEIQPFVPCGNTLTLTTDDEGNYKVFDNISCSAAPSGETTFASPGFVLLKTYMVEGSSLPTYTVPTSGDIGNSIFDIADSYSEWMFSESWIIEYVTALSMIKLGFIRRKLSNFSSLGNQGIQLDGAEMYSDGITQKDRLEEELDLKHAYEGMGIFLG